MKYTVTLALKKSFMDFGWEEEGVGWGDGPGAGILTQWPLSEVGTKDRTQDRTQDKVQKAVAVYTNLMVLQQIKPRLEVAASGKRWDVLEQDMCADLFKKEQSFHKDGNIDELRALYGNVKQQITGASQDDFIPMINRLAHECVFTA